MTRTLEEKRKRGSEANEAVGESSEGARIKRAKLERRPLSDDGGESEEEREDFVDTNIEFDDEGLLEGLSSDEEDEESDDNEPVFLDDAANVAAIERMRQRDRKMRAFGKESEAGVLKSISVIDFMNHRNTFVDFGTRMNFVVGKNGSGKSAILTAIAIALGGKAAQTGRANGMKELIRKGADKATIILTLINSGHAAFKPEIYNPEIVIERTLNSNGSSAYKFRATRGGKIHATKRDELQQLLEHFSIVIDSPLTILTQDAARNFLQSSNDSSLYKFFVQGTGLQGLTEQYSKLERNKQTLETHMSQQMAALQTKQAKLKDYLNRIAYSRKFADLGARNRRAYEELAWAYVIEKEVARDAAKRNCDQMQEKVNAVKEQVKQQEAAFKPIDEAVIQLQKEYDEFSRSRFPIQANRRKADSKLRTAQTAIREHKDVQRDLANEIKMKQAELAKATKTLADLQAGAAETEDPKQAALRREIDQYEVLLNKVRRELPVREEMVKTKEEEKAKVMQEIADLEHLRSQHQGEANQAQNTIRNLQRQATNRLSAFGTNVDQVLAEIDKVRWKHSKPLGPLGMYVSLEDHDYKDVISSHLGPTLCSFAVRCKEDAGQLAKILKRCLDTKGYIPGLNRKVVPPIIQHTGDLFDFSEGDMSRYGHTILSKLRITNEEVLRVLIVQRNIERIFVSDSVVAANQLLDDLFRQGLPSAVVHSKDRFNVSGSKDNRGTQAMQAWAGFTLFVKDVQLDIQENQRLFETADGLKTKYTQQIVELTATRNLANHAVVEAIRQVSKIRKNIPELQDKVISLRGQLKEHENETDQTVLEELRRSTEMTLMALEEELAAAERSMPNLEKDVEAFKMEIQEYDRSLETFDETLNQKQADITSMSENQQAANKTLKHYKSSENRYAADLAKLEEEFGRLEAAVKSWTEKALLIAPRMDVNKTVPELHQERARLEASLESGRRKGLQPVDELIAKQKALETQYEEDRAKVHYLDIFNQLFRKLISQRRRWWLDVREHVAVRARTLFILCSQRRGLESRLEFDHPHEKLIIRVSSGSQRRVDGEGTTVTGWKVPKNLSGGERSFSTVALMLAMWDVNQSPIRCLDEWDVFLDSVNRRTAAAMLVEGALASDQKQFILITPQDMSGVKLNANIKVIRMTDPERGQTTLNFANA